MEITNNKILFFVIVVKHFILCNKVCFLKKIICLAIYVTFTSHTLHENTSLITKVPQILIVVLR